MSTFSEAVARIGQSIALRCSATGVPPPRIAWTVDDRPLPAAPEKYVIIIWTLTGGFKVYFTKAEFFRYSVNTKAESLPGSEEGAVVSTLSVTVRTADEGGRYGCNATNSKGSHAHFARLNVFGKDYNFKHVKS